jgi:hypothetical protein|tara:strand:- start:1354 stop:2022 length:669 start_codon:yes stop_codon:yes gene_type:complete
MRNIYILSLLFISCFISKGQHIHNDTEHTFSLGIGGIISPYASLQLEHTFYKSKFSIGEHIKEFFTIKDKSILFTGPQLEIFGRIYFSDQRRKHGNHWFLHIKGGYGNMSIPSSSNSNDYLYDVNGVLILNNSGAPIKIFNNNFNRYGGGIAFGYKSCSCNDWIFEALLGYQLWASPSYYSNDYIEWKNEDPCNCTAYTSDRWTYGFPIDFQLKVGKLLRKK